MDNAESKETGQMDASPSRELVRKMTDFQVLLVVFCLAFQGIGSAFHWWYLGRRIDQLEAKYAYKESSDIRNKNYVKCECESDGANQKKSNAFPDGNEINDGERDE
jgi:hypothetical protein